MTISQYIKPLSQLCILLLTALNAFSQENYQRKLSVSELFDEIINCKDSVYHLKDAAIYFDLNNTDDKFFLPDESYFLPAKCDSIMREKDFKITAKIWLYNCSFPKEGPITLRYIQFKNTINIEDSENLFLDFDSCSFTYPVAFNHTSGNGLSFNKCSFFNHFEILNCNIDQFSARYCKFYSRFFLWNGALERIILYKNEFNIKHERWLILNTASDEIMFNFCNFQFEGGLSDHVESAGIRGWKGYNIINVYNCNFYVKAKAVFRINSEIKILGLHNNNFKNVIADFESSIISGQFVVDNCKFNLPLGLESFSFPDRTTNFKWNFLKGHKIALYDKYEDPPFQALHDSEMTNVYNVDELVSTYNQFYSMYKTRGDRESANGCFVEMKDIETRRLNYLYRTEGGMTNYFNWRLNQFLKFFCDYGTSPVKSLIISMWTILGFAVLYFFVYSDWDKINRSFLIKKHRKLLKYFRSEQKLEDFYTDNFKEDFKTYEDYKKELEESKIEVPFFINLLGKPLYHLSLTKHRTMTWLYRRTEILSGRWTDLKPARKIIIGSTVGLAITGYLFYLGLIRAINSIVLSINTFSTLGFGDIPVRGLSRYVAILEGFLGWFLLSIFSVSLISQILQN